MEASLDAISEGKQDWQRYLIDWNQQYFLPALDQAQQMLPEVPSHQKNQRSQRTLAKSRTKCPQCQQPLSKVPTKKVKKGYFSQM